MDVLAFAISLACLDPIDIYPPIQDVHRFPPLAVCQEAKAFNHRFREYLRGRMTWDLARAEMLRDVQAEAEACFQAWDWAAAAAGGEGRDTRYHRYSLWRLRDLIGWEAYYAGDIGPCVPLWRFSAAD